LFFVGNAKVAKTSSTIYITQFSSSCQCNGNCFGKKYNDKEGCIVRIIIIIIFNYSELCHECCSQLTGEVDGRVLFELSKSIKVFKLENKHGEHRKRIQHLNPLTSVFRACGFSINKNNISKACSCTRITTKGWLASNCFDAWTNAGFIASSHMEWRTLDCCTINWMYSIAWTKVLIYSNDTKRRLIRVSCGVNNSITTWPQSTDMGEHLHKSCQTRS